jgi:acylphosphatase
MSDPGRPGDRSGWVTERWWVSGRVQGVGFRYHVYRAAQRFGLAGDVRNLPDGRVEVRVEGPTDRVSALRAVVESGPPGSRVAGMETSRLERSLGFESFSIR